ncbi:MAG: flagellin FliC [Bacteriovoracaceae bacterium]|nr:flagellin FliC [Bacteriovoracaceae bacterium]
MGFRINTNTASISAQRSLGNVNREQADGLAKLASGSRIVKASDDAAGLAISEKLKANIRSSMQADRNANDGISMIQVAEGGLNEVQNILTRFRELAIQSSSDTVGETEREFTDKEFQQLKLELQRISEVTQFNGTSLLDGEGDEKEFQIGLNNDAFQDRIVYDASAISAGLDALGIDDMEVASKEGAQDSLADIDSAITTVSGHRATLGALQNRLISTSQNLQISVENQSAANSRIRDLDYASETAKNVQKSILQNAGTSVLAQANSKDQAALRLIG